MLIAKWHRKQIELLGSTIIEWFAYGLAVFLILFPKGGFKVGPIPLTWGYGLIGIALLFGVPFCIFGSSFKVHRGTMGAFLCLIPLQLVFIYSLLANGIGNFGFTLGNFVNFLVLPIAFLSVFPRFLQEIRMERLLVLARWLIFIAAAYGIFLFFWRLYMGNYIEIPYLTVNIGDLGTLDSKFNSRPDGLFKLISTYNNGNQYGVATLLLLPLYDAFESSRFRKLLVRVALLLTLSRTVWVGLVLNEVLDIFRYLWRDIVSSSKLSLRHSTFFRVLRLASLSGLVLGIAILISGVSFLFDPTLGGRAPGLHSHFTLLPAVPLAQFGEIIYITGAIMLGWVGLAALVILFCSPLLLAVVFKELRRTPLQIAALQGLVLYIALAGMDGALDYIPTMAFYWFLWMLLIHGRKDTARFDKSQAILSAKSPGSALEADGFSI